jgi:DNA-binding response OmpR family regulator
MITTRKPRAVPVSPPGLRTALVVDTGQADDANTRHLLQDLLDLHGYQVHTANSADAAITALVEASPECALLDLGSTPADTYDLLRALRRHPGGGECVMVVLTTHDMTDDWLAWDNGPDLFLTKPFDTQALLTYLDSRQSARAQAAALPRWPRQQLERQAVVSTVRSPPR